MEYLHKIKVKGTRISVILASGDYPRDPLPNPDRQAEPFHEHPVFETFFIKSGAVEIYTPSEGASYSDCIVLIPPHVRHRTVPQNCNARVIPFIPDPKYENEAKISKDLVNAIGTKIRVFPLDDATRFYIDRIQSTPSNEDIPHLLALLFSTFFSNFDTKTIADQDAQPYRTKHISATESFITTNVYCKIHLSDLAKELSLSEKQCARMLKKYFGCTLSELIHKARMEVAEVMLKYTDHDIVKIAHSIGYEYENYFFTVFRKHYGVTPSEYRAKALEELKKSTNTNINDYPKKEDIWTS